MIPPGLPSTGGPRTARPSSWRARRSSLRGLLVVYPRIGIHPDEAAALLSGLVAVNRQQMRAAGPRRPRVWQLLRSGALYYERRDPREHWQTYRDVMGALRARGRAGADCEDLSALVAAELGEDGMDPAARPYVYHAQDRTYHVVVASPKFGYLDPSIAGGM